MKGHTGASMSMGTGSPYSASLKQKLVSHSSSESELIGVHNILPQILWTSHFLDAQGYGVKRTVLKQDNKSSILLEQNGRASSSKRTKHIQIHYFFSRIRWMLVISKSSTARLKICMVTTSPTQYKETFLPNSVPYS